MRFRVLGLSMLIGIFGVVSAAPAQIPGLKKPSLGDLSAIPGVDNIFKKGPAITTNIKDAKYEDATYSPARTDFADLFSLPRTKEGGFVLAAGHYGATLQSYCLHAGTHGPSSGDGYLYAPVKGPYEKFVMHVAQRSVDHPEIDQHDVQVLLWALIARTKISDMPRPMQATASKLLLANELVDLNGGALGILQDDKIAGAFLKQPPLLRQVFEAEAKLRSALTNPNSNYAEFERIAVLFGDTEMGPGSRDVPSGRWSLHPDGYYVRYVPVSYPTTKIEVVVPEGSKAIGKTFDPASQIATPANTARQRLIQSGRRKAGEFTMIVDRLKVEAATR